MSLQSCGQTRARTFLVATSLKILPSMFTALGSLLRMFRSAKLQKEDFLKVLDDLANEHDVDELSAFEE